MLGHWKDYEELEESLSMPELTATLTAMYKAEERKNKFAASLAGVDMGESSEETKASGQQPSTFEEIQARALARLNGDTTSVEAIRQGFTPDLGISYAIIGDSDS